MQTRIAAALVWAAAAATMAACGDDDAVSGVDAGGGGGDGSPGDTDAAAGGTDAAPSDAPPACDLPALPQETVDQLLISILPSLQLQPGQSIDLDVGTEECCYFFIPADACVRWSVTPTDGVTIGATSGVLEVGDEVPSGAVFTVTADVENGRRLVSIDAYVYTPEANPLVGYWHETAELSCETGLEVAPEEAINELRFSADGRIDVTWFPFELYVDYWGRYTFDLGAGTLSFVVDSGNYIPDDVDGAGGHFEIDDRGRLVLRDLWLGTPSGGSGAARCGHVFEH